MRITYAEELPYFKTGRSSPDVWLDKSLLAIKKINGRPGNYGRLGQGEKEVFAIEFNLGQETYRIAYDVKPTRNGKDILAARRQAATAMYHHVRALCDAYLWLGKGVFTTYEILPSGQTVGELLLATPQLLLSVGEL